jgi:hypothetical protein
MAAHYEVTIVDGEPAYEERKTSTQTKKMIILIMRLLAK